MPQLCKYPDQIPLLSGYDFLNSRGNKTIELIRRNQHSQNQGAVRLLWVRIGLLRPLVTLRPAASILSMSWKGTATSLGTMTRPDRQP